MRAPIPEAQKVLETYANDRGVTLKSEGKDWKIFISKEGFYFNDATIFKMSCFKRSSVSVSELRIEYNANASALITFDMASFVKKRK